MRDSRWVDHAKSRNALEVSPIPGHEIETTLERSRRDESVRRRDAAIAPQSAGAFSDGAVDGDLSERSEEGSDALLVRRAPGEELGARDHRIGDAVTSGLEPERATQLVDEHVRVKQQISHVSASSRSARNDAPIRREKGPRSRGTRRMRPRTRPQPQPDPRLQGMHRSPRGRVPRASGAPASVAHRVGGAAPLSDRSAFSLPAYTAQYTALVASHRVAQRRRVAVLNYFFRSAISPSSRVR